ncbi:hypothetical protein ACFLYK_03040, partial [Candidatus Cloacimonadota bacterium]
MDIETRNRLRQIPGVDVLLNEPEILKLIRSYG